MKRTSNIFIALIICFVSALALSGCGETKITSAFVKSGTLVTTVVKGEEVNTSNVVVIVKYSNNTQEEVTTDNLTFGTVDTSTTGTKQLEITYTLKSYSFNVAITVVATEADVNSINKLESQLLIDYANNKKTQINKQEEFYDREQPLVVGDDNAFNFRINASGISPSGELVTNLKKVRTNIVVEELQGSAYVLLTDDALTNMVTIDTENTTLDFTEQAIGKTFKVTVQAANRDLDYEESSTKFTANLVVEDGFNVYTAKELSVYDNVNNDAYSEIKTELGIKDLKVNSVILQNDINVTKNDVRQDIFWKTTDSTYNAAKLKTDQTLEGSLKDYGSVYLRQISNGEKFNFNGNYFQVSVKDLPKSVVESDGSSKDHKGVNTAEGKESMMTSHACLFKTEQKTDSTIDSNTQVNWKNVLLSGNGPIGADPRNSGALLLMKNQEINFKAFNTLTKNFYITYFFELGNLNNDFVGNYEIDKCKAFDSFQNLMYMWGAKNVLISNSEFVGAGGPVVIADHAYGDTNGDGGNPSQVNIVNTKLESKVSGKEPWFETYEGSGALVGQFALTEAFYNGQGGLPATGKTIIADKVKDPSSSEMIPRLNITVVMKSGSVEGLSTSKIRGYVRNFNTMEEYNKFYGLNDETQSVTTYGLDMTNSPLRDKAINGNTNYLQSNGSGGYVNTNMQDGSNNDTTCGMVRAIKLYGALLSVNAGVPGLDLNSFSAKPLTEQKTILSQIFSNIPAQFLNDIYNGALSINAIDAIDGFIELTEQAKKEALINAINAFDNASFAQGNYINIYLFNGMGVMIQLYNAQA